MGPKPHAHLAEHAAQKLQELKRLGHRRRRAGVQPVVACRRKQAHVRIKALWNRERGADQCEESKFVTNLKADAAFVPASAKGCSSSKRSIQNQERYNSSGSLGHLAQEVRVMQCLK